jgi:hypothetical protein
MNSSALLFLLHCAPYGTGHLDSSRAYIEETDSGIEEVNETNEGTDESTRGNGQEIRKE